MRVWIALVVAAFSCGMLGFRVVELEHRVDRLSQPRSADANTGATDASTTPDADAEHARRLDDLAADVAALREDVDALSDEAQAKVDREDLDRSTSPDRILGVVTQEALRVRDRQVDFHRDRWVDMRERAAEEFAARHALTRSQASEIQRLLVAEVDEMVAIFKAHGADEDPKEAVAEWMEMLRETDRKAKRILSPEQVAPWDAGRTYERKVFMPWLPQ